MLKVHRVISIKLQTLRHMMVGWLIFVTLSRKNMSSRIKKRIACFGCLGYLKYFIGFVRPKIVSITNRNCKNKLNGLLETIT